MKKIFISLFVLIILGLFSTNTIFAQANNFGSLSGGVIVATVSINNAKIVSQNDRDFVISFSIGNKTGVQPKIKYSVLLMKNTSASKTILDEKVYSDSTYLNENTSVNKSINYSIPSSFSAGLYTLYLRSKNESGLPLAIARLGDIKIADTASSSVEIIPNSCVFEDNSKPIVASFSQNIVQTTFKAKCKVKNTFPKDLTLSTDFLTRRYSSFGPIVIGSRNLKSDLIIKKGLSDINFEAPKITIPQKYNLAFTLKSADSKIVSNTISYDYVTAGDTGLIRNVIFDKTYYKVGETANVSVFSTQNSTSTISLTILNNNRIACSATSTKQISNLSLINLLIPITKDCPNPQADVSIYSGAKLLDSSNFNISPLQGKATSTKATSSNTLIIILILFFIALTIFFFVLKRNRKAINIIIILFILFSVNQIAFAAPVISSFTSDVSNPVPYKGTITVSATVSNSSYCIINGGYGGSWYFPLEGSQTTINLNAYYMTASTTFDLVCMDSAQEQAESIIDVYVESVPTFTATLHSPGSVAINGFAKLLWEANDVNSSCSISLKKENGVETMVSEGLPASNMSSGLSVGPISATTTFTLNCSHDLSPGESQFFNDINNMPGYIPPGYAPGAILSISDDNRVTRGMCSGGIVDIPGGNNDATLLFTIDYPWGGIISDVDYFYNPDPNTGYLTDPNKEVNMINPGSGYVKGDVVGVEHGSAPIFEVTGANGTMGEIKDYMVDNGGHGYKVGDKIYIGQNGNDSPNAIFDVTSVSSGGKVTGLGDLYQGGSSYINNTEQDLGQDIFGGPTGSGAKVRVFTDESGNIVDYSLISSGTGYMPGEFLQVGSGDSFIGIITDGVIPGSVQNGYLESGSSDYNIGDGYDLYNSAPPYNFDLKILSVYDGAITGLKLVEPGGCGMWGQYQLTGGSALSGTPAILSLNGIGNGEIESINLLNPGSGYSVGWYGIVGLFSIHVDSVTPYIDPQANNTNITKNANLYTPPPSVSDYKTIGVSSSQSNPKPRITVNKPKITWTIEDGSTCTLKINGEPVPPYVDMTKSGYYSDPNLIVGDNVTLECTDADGPHEYLRSEAETPNAVCTLSQSQDDGNYYVNKNTTWTMAMIDGTKGTFSNLSWSGTDIPHQSTITSNPMSIIYTTVGTKDIFATGTFIPDRGDETTQIFVSCSTSTMVKLDKGKNQEI